MVWEDEWRAYVGVCVVCKERRKRREIGKKGGEERRCGVESEWCVCGGREGVRKGRRSRRGRGGEDR